MMAFWSWKEGPFWEKEKAGFGEVLIWLLFCSINIANLAINIRYSGIFFA
jgi:hypothetical protein